MSLAPNSFGQGTGLRLMRQRDNRLVINGIVDTLTLSLHQSAIIQRPGAVFYTTGDMMSHGHIPIQVSNEFQGDAQQPFEREPVFIWREAALRSGVKKHGKYSETRLPVIATFNGAVAATRAQLCARIAFIGLAELTGRDTATPGMSISAGGILTTTNQGTQDITMGAYVLATPPPLEVVRGHMLNPAKGNMANTKGRIPGIFEEYNPKEHDFYDGAQVRRVLGTKILELFRLPGGRVRLQKQPKAQRAVDKKELRSEVHYRETLEHLLDAYAGLIQAANARDWIPAGVAGGVVEPDPESIDFAAKYMIASGLLPAPRGAPANAPIGTEYMDEFLQSHTKPGGAQLKLAKDVDPTAYDRFAGDMRTFVQDPHNQPALQKRPNDMILRSMANMRMSVNDLLAGMALTTARPRNDFELHLGR